MFDQLKTKMHSLGRARIVVRPLGTDRSSLQEYKRANDISGTERRHRSFIPVA